MSLAVCLSAPRVTNVFEGNLTHNLTKMANEAGIYYHLWRPEEIGITTAGDLILPLRDALAAMKTHPEKFYLAACEENPDAEIRTSR